MSDHALPVLIAQTLAVSGVLMLGPAVSTAAESQYGYTTATSSKVTAQARVNITVNIPKLILLQVGSGKTSIDTVTMSMTPSIPAPTVPAAGSYAHVNRPGAEPAFTGANRNRVAVSVWTNSPSGGSVGCPATTSLPAAGALGGSYLAAAVELSSSIAGTSCSAATMTSFGTNTAVNIDTAGLSAAAMVGSHTETVTYTATSL
jgi:hypothetical protein